MSSARFDSEFDQYYGNQVAAFAPVNERSLFIQRTYMHLAGAVALFVAVEYVLLQLIGPQAQQALLQTMLGNRLSWFLVLGAFMAVSWFAQTMASQETSIGMQYVGLGLYSLAEAVVIFPLLALANRVEPSIIPTAGLLTLIVFGGLTALVFVTKADFSSLGRYLWFGAILSMGIVICALVFGFSLGIWYSAAMVALMAGYILYDTSNVMHHYKTTQYVAAALALFASLATLFYYIVRLLMSMQSRNND